MRAGPPGPAAAPPPAPASASSPGPVSRRASREAWSSGLARASFPLGVGEPTRVTRSAACGGEEAALGHAPLDWGDRALSAGAPRQLVKDGHAGLIGGGSLGRGQVEGLGSEEVRELDRGEAWLGRREVGSLRGRESSQSGGGHIQLRGRHDFGIF